MPVSMTDVESQALLLSREDRAKLADHLLLSLYPDQDLDEAWSVEVDRRWAEIESGKDVCISLEESIARARKLLV